MQLRTHRFVFQLNFLKTAETRNRFGIAKEQGMLHQMAKSAIWQDQKNFQEIRLRKLKLIYFLKRIVREFVRACVQLIYSLSLIISFILHG